MRTGYTHISVVLDRSGSMASIKDDTEGGFATFLADQKAEPGEASIELRQFDTIFEVVYPPTPIEHAEPLVLAPRGGTALLDAMGRAITETKEWLDALDEDMKPENVVMAIITDGQENSSVEWTHPRVMELVKQQTDAGWTFLYLGANQDAIAVGASVGIAAANSMSYTGQTVGSTYSSLSSSVTRTRTTGSATAGFTQQERQDAGGSAS